MRLHRVAEIDGLQAALADSAAGSDSGGVVFAAHAAPDDGWPQVARELLSAFELTRDAFEGDEPIVYVVRHSDLLGHGGAPGAMLSSALLSAARALAMEDRDGRIPVNVVAYDERTQPAPLAAWIAWLLGQPDVSGELIRVGRAHLGRLVP